jgi:hypothetical protein
VLVVAEVRPTGTEPHDDAARRFIDERSHLHEPRPPGKTSVGVRSGEQGAETISDFGFRISDWEKNGAGSAGGWGSAERRQGESRANGTDRRDEQDCKMATRATPPCWPSCSHKLATLLAVVGHLARCGWSDAGYRMLDAGGRRAEE